MEMKDKISISIIHRKLIQFSPFHHTYIYVY